MSPRRLSLASRLTLAAEAANLTLPLDSGSIRTRAQTMDTVSILLAVGAIIAGLFVAYNVFHYILFLLVTHPRRASKIGHRLNEFEQRQLVEWTPRADDCLKHDDEHRTYDDVFGAYRDEHANYSTCIFPRAVFGSPYEAELILLKPKDGMRLPVRCSSAMARFSPPARTARTPSAT